MHYILNNSIIGEIIKFTCENKHQIFYHTKKYFYKLNQIDKFRKIIINSENKRNEE